MATPQTENDIFKLPPLGMSKKPEIQQTGYSSPASPFVNPWNVNQSTLNSTSGVDTANKLNKGIAKPVAMLSTDSAIKTVNKDKSFLDTTYPAQTAALASEGESEVPAYDPAKGSRTYQSRNGVWTDVTDEMNKKNEVATFINQNGQEMELSPSQLNDQKTKDFLTQNGFVVSKSSFPVDLNTTTLQNSVNDAASKVEKLANDFLSYNVDQDPDYIAQANAIRQNFSRLRGQLQEANTSRQRQLETLGMRSGTTQYAGAIQMGIEGEELEQANQRMADLNSEEAQAISAARLAYKTGKFNEFNQKVTALKDIRDQKQKELENYNTSLKNVSERLLNQEKFNFEVYKFQQEQKAGSKPMVVAPGSSIYDPSTGEFIGTAPKPAETKAPEIQKWGGQVHQWNPVKQSWETLGSEKAEGYDTNLTSAANLIAQGKAKLTDYDQDQRPALSAILEKMPPKPQEIATTQTKIKELQGLLNHAGLNSSVGPNESSRRAYFDAFGNKADFIGKVQKLLSQKVLDQLISAKANGATFGALSEGELKILQEAATTIGSWVTKDEKGNITGYNVSEKAFKDELKRIKGEYENLLTEAIGASPAQKTLQDFYNNNPAQRGYIEQLYNKTNPATGQPFTEEEISQVLGISFNQAGSAAQSAQQVAQAIGRKESGGNYNARGKDGEVGKYQIMPNNYKAWAREAGVNPNDISPQAQDKIANYKIQQYMQRYNNDPVAVAIAWNAGPGRANEYMKTGKVPGLTGTSAGGGYYNVPKYVKDVLSYLG
jgi:hypothetical protein